METSGESELDPAQPSRIATDWDRSLAAQVVKEFLELSRRGQVVSSTIQIYGAERILLEKLATEIQSLLSQSAGVRIVIETHDAPRSPDRASYYLDVGYFWSRRSPRPASSPKNT